MYICEEITDNMCQLGQAEFHSEKHSHRWRGGLWQLRQQNSAVEWDGTGILYFWLFSITIINANIKVGMLIRDEADISTSDMTITLERSEVILSLGSS